MEISYLQSESEPGKSIPKSVRNGYLVLSEDKGGSRSVILCLTLSGTPSPPPQPTESQQSLKMCESKKRPFRANVDEQSLQVVPKEISVERKHKIVHDKRLERKQLFQIMPSMFQNYSKSLNEDSRAIFFQLCK